MCQGGYEPVCAQSLRQRNPNWGCFGVQAPLSVYTHARATRSRVRGDTHGMRSELIQGRKL